MEAVNPRVFHNAEHGCTERLVPAPRHVVGSVHPASVQHSFHVFVCHDNTDVQDRRELLPGWGFVPLPGFVFNQNEIAERHGWRKVCLGGAHGTRMWPLKHISYSSTASLNLVEVKSTSKFEATVGVCTMTHSGVRFQADVLVQDVMEVASLVRSFRNSLVPMSRMPVEIFFLIPHYWERRNDLERQEADRDLISMTQVCRRWREILTLHCSSLWTNLDLEHPDKTRVYVERSRSLPLKITLTEMGGFTRCNNPFLEVVPHLNRLGSLTIKAHVGALSGLPNCFPSPAPILKELRVLLEDEGDYDDDLISSDLEILGTIFPEDPPLRKLSLSGIIKNLPSMTLPNLTVFELRNPEDMVDPPFVTQILDFLASAPLLRRIVLCVDIPASFDHPPQRAISLPDLEKLVIDNIPLNSTLLDHLSIPAGVSLDLTLWCPPDADPDKAVCLRRIIDDLRHVTTVNLFACSGWERMRLDGLNGETRLWGSWAIHEAPMFFPSLRKFDLSKTQKLSITGYERLRSLKDETFGDSTIFQTLRTCDLRALTLTNCENTPFIHALNPGRNRPVFCPNLEELVFYIDTDTHEESFREDLVEMASERAKISSKLSSIKIHGGKGDFSLLREYVPHVEHEWESTTPPEWDAAFGDVWDDYNPHWYRFI